MIFRHGLLKNIAHYPLDYCHFRSANWMEYHITGRLADKLMSCQTSIGGSILYFLLNKYIVEMIQTVPSQSIPEKETSSHSTAIMVADSGSAEAKRLVF